MFDLPHRIHLGLGAGNGLFTVSLVLYHSLRFIVHFGLGCCHSYHCHLQSARSCCRWFGLAFSADSSGLISCRHSDSRSGFQRLDRLALSWCCSDDSCSESYAGILLELLGVAASSKGLSAGCRTGHAPFHLGCSGYLPHLVHLLSLRRSLRLDLGLGLLHMACELYCSTLACLEAGLEESSPKERRCGSDPISAEAPTSPVRSSYSQGWCSTVDRSLRDMAAILPPDNRQSPFIRS